MPIDDAPKAQGYERYEPYHYLWHLIAIGAIRAKNPNADGQAYEIEAAAWCAAPGAEDAAPGAGEIVALIDTGVNPLHPNLSPEAPAGPRILPGADFAAHPFGLTYAAPPAALAPLNPAPLVEAKVEKTRGLEQGLADSLVDAATWSDALALFATGAPNDPEATLLLQRLRAGRGVRQSVAQRDRLSYSSHGTACAGLIVGAPPTPAPPPAPDVEDDRPLPYWGVAPGAQLLPITVSAQPTAEQLIMAFLHAASFAAPDGRKVSVIHFPREAPDPVRAHRFAKDFEDSRYGDAAARLAWDVFRAVLDMVSDRVPVIVAAGNEGFAHLSYPASAARAGNGIVSVGALSHAARRSGYSNYADPAGPEALTIAAPSDDAEALTRRQVRLDREAPRWRDHNFLLHLEGPAAIPEVVFSPQAVLAPDIPGPRGYAHGALQGGAPELGLARDRTALYTLFGGTSAASAIVAGAAALRQAKARLDTGAPLDGAQMKAALSGAGADPIEWPWLDAAVSLAEAADAPNGEDPSAADLPARQFGAGALDLAALLA